MELLTSNRSHVRLLIGVAVACLLLVYSSGVYFLSETETDEVENIKHDDVSKPKEANITRKTDNMNLVICARVLNEAPYLQEWIEYHRMIGFDSFVLLNHNSSDETQCVLDSYSEQGIVTRLPEDIDKKRFHGRGASQVFLSCVDHLAAQDDSTRTWMFTQDTDEFLWYKTDFGIHTIKDAFRSLLEAHGHVESVRIPRLTFGSSGRDLYEPKLVIERFTHRFDSNSCPRHTRQRQLFDHSHPLSYCEEHRGPDSFDDAKSISLVSSLALHCTYLNTTSMETHKVGCHTPHHHKLANQENGTAIVLNGKPDFTGPKYLDEKHVGDKLTILHYRTKSRQEFYDRVCVSGFVGKYRQCTGCSPASYFDLFQTYANNFKDERMLPFASALHPILDGKSPVSRCNTKPWHVPPKVVQECLTPQT